MGWRWNSRGRGIAHTRVGSIEVVGACADSEMPEERTRQAAVAWWCGCIFDARTLPLADLTDMAQGSKTFLNGGIV
jgi:hypothetical protein